MTTVTKLQQHLPFTVLKLEIVGTRGTEVFSKVATALTVYGIETNKIILDKRIYRVATALTVYGIETLYGCPSDKPLYLQVATALTVYGIETR